MGHNYYGEPAWPNDLLYIFPVCILGTIACCIGLGVLEPTPLGEKADPFATPLEILPEWYFFPTFNFTSCYSEQATWSNFYGCGTNWFNHSSIY